MKEGRAFDLHHVTASQDGKPVMTMTCSFTADTEGYVYDLSGIPAGVPLPDDLPEPDEVRDEAGPWDERWVGASARARTGPARRRTGTGSASPATWATTRTCTRRCSATPPTGPASAGGRWTSTGDTTGMISLDHAAWFHRPARVDEWLLQDVQSLVNAGGRGTLRGVIRDLDGRIVASMAQEMLLQPVTS